MLVVKVPRPVPPPPTPLEAPVPLLEATPTADAGAIAMRVLPGKLPAAGQNQIRDPKKCPRPAKFIEGGCWMAVADEEPPCEKPGEPKVMWAHAGRCWVPYAAARLPQQSGDPRPVGLADP
jgi:hypothetical protein